MTMVHIRSYEINEFVEYIYSISGISYDQSKAYLIESRFAGLIDELGCSSFSELLEKAKTDPSKALERQIIDLITTQETLFFRNAACFQLLQYKILPDLIDKRTNSSNIFPTTIRIWSSACSTGQEIYSIAMIIKELLPDHDRFDIRLLGTDISDEAIAKASSGAYSRFEATRGLSQDYRLKYFVPRGNRWVIRDDLRAMVHFKKLNLMTSSYNLDAFDVILCRNVAIYFNKDDKKKFFNKIASVLRQDGYLIIGATETLTGICDRFEPKEYLRSYYYQLKNHQLKK